MGTAPVKVSRIRYNKLVIAEEKILKIETLIRNGELTRSELELIVFG